MFIFFSCFVMQIIFCQIKLLISLKPQKRNLKHIADGVQAIADTWRDFCLCFHSVRFKSVILRRCKEKLGLSKHARSAMQDYIKQPLLQLSRCSQSCGWNASLREAPGDVVRLRIKDPHFVLTHECGQMKDEE